MWNNLPGTTHIYSLTCWSSLSWPWCLSLNTRSVLLREAYSHNTSCIYYPTVKGEHWIATSYASMTDNHKSQWPPLLRERWHLIMTWKTLASILNQCLHRNWGLFAWDLGGIGLFYGGKHRTEWNQYTLKSLPVVCLFVRLFVCLVDVPKYALMTSPIEGWSVCFVPPQRWGGYRSGPAFPTRSHFLLYQ